VEVFFFPGEEKVVSPSGDSSGALSVSPADSFLPERYSDEETDEGDTDVKREHREGDAVLGEYPVTMDNVVMEDSDDDVADDRDSSFNPDDEFCIIDDAGLGIAVSVPPIKWRLSVL